MGLYSYNDDILYPYPPSGGQVIPTSEERKNSLIQTYEIAWKKTVESRKCRNHVHSHEKIFTRLNEWNLLTTCENIYLSLSELRVFFYKNYTLFDMKVTVCYHVWIINEVLVNFKKWCHTWSSWPKNTPCTNFQRILTLFDMKVTVCHHVWIINEVLVNFKNWCHIRSSRVKNTPCTNFQRIPTLFDTRMTTLSLFYCTRRGMCHLFANN